MDNSVLRIQIFRAIYNCTGGDLLNYTLKDEIDQVDLKNYLRKSKMDKVKQGITQNGTENKEEIRIATTDQFKQ